MKPIRMLLVLSIAIAGVACSSGPKGATSFDALTPWEPGQPCPTDGVAPGATRPSSTGSIQIVKPTSGELIEGSSVSVEVKVTGACVVVGANKLIRRDSGHIHLSVDGKIVTLLAGLEYTIDDLKAGTHLLEAEFSAADHNPFNPRVVETVSFRVTG